MYGLIPNGEPRFTMAIKPDFLEKLKRKAYRRAYLRDTVTSWIVYQLKNLREQRGWTQAKLASEAGTSQPAIARIERSDYGKWNIATLLDMADAFDVALEVRFVDWPTFTRRARDLESGLDVASFSESQFAPPPAKPSSAVLHGAHTLRGDRSVWDTQVRRSLDSIASTSWALRPPPMKNIQHRNFLPAFAQEAKKTGPSAWI